MTGRNAWAVAFVVVATCVARGAGAVEIQSVTRVDGGGPVLVGQRVEFAVVLGKSYANPFDPVAMVKVAASFTREGGAPVIVGGFWFQDYVASYDQGRETLTPRGDPGWRVRFRPMEAGTYTMGLTVLDVAEGVTTEGPTGADAQTLDAGTTALPTDGFVTVDDAPGQQPGFQRNGKPWVPFGANVCWSGAGGTKDIEGWYQEMKTAGLQWSRLWMTSFDGTALEWKTGADDGGYAGLGTYNLKAAWRVDRILQLAEERGIALQLVLQQHSQFECQQWSSWGDNPWNVANGGPCRQSMEFFTNADVAAGFDARLRYIAARFADSPAIMAWELWNEVDLITGYQAEVVATWAHQRVPLLKSMDPYGHLVTTSYAWPPADDQDWQYEGYDFAQFHSYLAMYADWLPQWASDLRKYGKPVVLGEFGIDTQGSDNLKDTDGTHLVNATMLSVLSGFTGGAMSWWWDNYLTPDGLWMPLGNVAARLRAVGAAHVVEPLPADSVTVTEADPVVDGHAVEGRAARTTDGVLVWLHDAGSEWNRAADWAPIDHIGVVVDVAGVRLDGGLCRGFMQQCDPRGDCADIDGAQSTQDTAEGAIRLTADVFTRDLLIQVHCLGSFGEDPGGAGDTAGGEDSGTTDGAGSDDGTPGDGMDAADVPDEPEAPRPRSRGCSAAF
jgi:hypothetical protein